MESNGPLLSSPRPVFPSTPHEVPSLFLSGCVGNVAEATRKWQHAYKWRQAFNIPQVRHSHFSTPDMLRHTEEAAAVASRHTPHTLGIIQLPAAL